MFCDQKTKLFILIVFDSQCSLFTPESVFLLDAEISNEYLFAINLVRYCLHRLWHTLVIIIIFTFIYKNKRFMKLMPQQSFLVSNSIMFHIYVKSKGFILFWILFISAVSKNCIASTFLRPSSLPRALMS